MVRVQYPVEKDDTDAMLAVRVGLERGCDRFLFYGAMDGPRLDHTVANFQTLAYLCTHGARGWLVGRDYMATVLCEEEIEFSGEAEGILSLFCLGASAEVSIRGLHYELDRGTSQTTGVLPQERMTSQMSLIKVAYISSVSSFLPSSVAR